MLRQAPSPAEASCAAGTSVSTLAGGASCSLLAAALVFVLGGCGSLREPAPVSEVGGERGAVELLAALAASPVASHHRNWRPEQAVLPYAELDSSGATVRHVRQCRWRSESDKDVQHTDWTFAWDDVRGVDFVVVPFQTAPLLAHTMLSFELADGRYLVASVEARLAAGQSYSPLAGAARQFELMYVLGDELDLIGLRAETRRDDVYVHRAAATAEQSAALLRDILERVNQIAARPEFYDTLTNNCTTNIVAHINKLAPSSVPNDLRALLPGQSDQLAYDLGLLATELPFPQARAEAYVSHRARQHLDDADFSRLIRR